MALLPLSALLFCSTYRGQRGQQPAPRVATGQGVLRPPPGVPCWPGVAEVRLLSPPSRAPFQGRPGGAELAAPAHVTCPGSRCPSPWPGLVPTAARPSSRPHRWARAAPGPSPAGSSDPLQTSAPASPRGCGEEEPPSVLHPGRALEQTDRRTHCSGWEFGRASHTGLRNTFPPAAVPQPPPSEHHPRRAARGAVR